MGFFSFFKKKKKFVNVEKSNINKELKKIITDIGRNEISILIDEFKEVQNPRLSKVGGKPFLPKDFIWPKFKSYDDGIERPLSFLCQINLEEIKDYDLDGLLPKKGMLYFFYECESQTWGFNELDKDAIKVYYYDDIEGFIELSLPKELEKQNIIPEIAMDFISKKSYPRFEEFSVYNDYPCDWEEYDDVLKDLGVDIEIEENHKLLGFADIIQNEMITEFETDIDQLSDEWILLLQISTIAKDDFEMMFGDCGMLYFYIRKTDLLEQNFNNIKFSLQCY